MHEPWKIETKITGIQFRGPEAQSILGQISAPFEFILQREPSNRWDVNAIMVIVLHNEDGAPRSVEAVEEMVGLPRTNPAFIKECSKLRSGGVHAGYIPKADNGPFAAAMDEGLPVKAEWSEHEAYGLILTSDDGTDLPDEEEEPDEE